MRIYLYNARQEPVTEGMWNCGRYLGEYHAPWHADRAYAEGERFTLYQGGCTIGEEYVVDIVDGQTALAHRTA